MASSCTTNYQLNQWEAADKVLREEFNQDNAKIDEALAQEAKARAAVEQALAAETAARIQADTAFGNCKMVYGTYVGNGAYGAGTPTQLTFPFEPKLVIVQMRDAAQMDDRNGVMMILVRPLQSFSFSKGVYVNSISWSGNSVSWTGWDAHYQFNASGATYLYIAFG